MNVTFWSLICGRLERTNISIKSRDSYFVDVLRKFIRYLFVRTIFRSLLSEGNMELKCNVRSKH